MRVFAIYLNKKRTSYRLIKLDPRVYKGNIDELEFNLNGHNDYGSMQLV